MPKSCSWEIRDFHIISLVFFKGTMGNPRKRCPKPGTRHGPGPGLVAFQGDFWTWDVLQEASLPAFCRSQ